jgi:hypothetical protein
MAIQVADDDGAHPARILPEQVVTWVGFANRVFYPAGIRIDFDRTDIRPLRSTLINRLQGPEQPDWAQGKRAADDVAARYPDHLVVFFRHGGGDHPTGAGLAWTDYNFVVMPGWPDDRHCDHDHVSALAHEIGHHLGLRHTFARTFPERSTPRTSWPGATTTARLRWRRPERDRPRPGRPHHRVHRRRGAGARRPGAFRCPVATSCPTTTSATRWVRSRSSACAGSWPSAWPIT